ncbi:MAG: hypothetical protein HY645_03110 [Acidobacteria bacterium]|nr:hypothetical protein [Acidobacteriota bacterium]
MKFLLKCLMVALAAVLLTAGVLYSLWLNRVRVADGYFEAGRYQEARVAYQKAREAWELRLLPSFWVQEGITNVSLNLAQIGYFFGEYEKSGELLQLEAETFPALRSNAQHALWMGNALMATALMKEHHEQAAFMDLVTRAAKEYQEALRRDPGLWDAKFNFEVATHLLDQLRKTEEKDGKELRILLEKVRTDFPRQKKELPPHKRSHLLAPQCRGYLKAAV